jgi:hypothetical protein
MNPSRHLKESCKSITNYIALKLTVERSVLEQPFFQTIPHPTVYIKMSCNGRNFSTN